MTSIGESKNVGCRAREEVSANIPNCTGLAIDDLGTPLAVAVAVTVPGWMKRVLHDQLVQLCPVVPPPPSSQRLIPLTHPWVRLGIYW